MEMTLARETLRCGLASRGAAASRPAAPPATALGGLSANCAVSSGRKEFPAALSLAQAAARHTAPRSRAALAPVCVAATAEPEVTIDNCTVLVVGEGGVGMDVVRKLAKAGSWVTAFHTGAEHRKEIEGLGAMLAVGEATNADNIAKALRTNTFDAVIYVLGDDSGSSTTSLDAQKNVISAASGAGIPRFLLVSSGSSGDEGDLAAAEEALGANEALRWTIVLTGPLTAESPSGAPQLSEDKGAPKISIASSDLAWLVSQILFDADFEGKVLSAVKLEQ